MALQQLVLAIHPQSTPRFDNYLAGDNLELLLALHTLALGDYAEAITYCWGTEGCGRSHLLHATVAEAIQADRSALYVAADQPLPEELPDLLAVDDVQKLNPEQQIQLFSLINRAKEGQGSVLTAGDAPPAQLPLRNDLTTRLGWGLVYAIRPLNEADRATAMRERAFARGLNLPEEVTRYLLAHGRRDLPSLLASLDALDEYSLSLKRPLTVPLVRDWLAKHP